MRHNRACGREHLPHAFPPIAAPACLAAALRILTMSDAQATKPGRGRPRREVARKRPTTGDPIKPTVSGQIEPEEMRRLDELCKQTGRTRSYIVRAAVLLLLREHDSQRIDWAYSPEQAGFIDYRSREV
jgi:hypothetical protein